MLQRTALLHAHCMICMSTARPLGWCEKRKLAAHWKASIKAARYTAGPSQHLLIASYRCKKKHHVASHVGKSDKECIGSTATCVSFCKQAIPSSELQGFFILYCVGQDRMNKWSIEYNRVKLDVSNRISKPSFPASLFYQWMQSIYPRSWKVVLSCALDHDCEIALGWQSFVKVIHDVRTHDIECAQNQLAISCTACTKHKFESLMWAAT